jgi:hypothetical protein
MLGVHYAGSSLIGWHPRDMTSGESLRVYLACALNFVIVVQFTNTTADCHLAVVQCKQCTAFFIRVFNLQTLKCFCVTCVRLNSILKFVKMVQSSIRVNIFQLNYSVLLLSAPRKKVYANFTIGKIGIVRLTEICSACCDLQCGLAARRSAYCLIVWLSDAHRSDFSDTF